MEKKEIPKIYKFVVVFLVSFAGWWGINLLNEDLEDIFYWEEISRNPDVLLAQVYMNPRANRIIKIPAELNLEEEIEVKAKAAITVLVDELGRQKILFKKNIKEKMPIASITKLMTAIVSTDIYKNGNVIEISSNAVAQEDSRGNLEQGEKLPFFELIKSSLIESSNDAAFAIAEGITEEGIFGLDKFVSLMNLKAKEIGLNDTNFTNPTGLDGKENYSTCSDLLILSKYTINNYPEILNITKEDSCEVLNPDQTVHHYISENTNILLKEYPQIIGGKTGFTEEAGGCILLVFKKEDGNYIIHAILGTDSSEARFEEARKLINHFNY